MRRTWILLSALVFAVTSGCGRERRLGLIERLDGEPATRFFSVTDDLGESEVFAIADPPAIQLPEDGSNRPIADVPVDFEAADVQAIEVEVRGLPRGQLDLFWAGDAADRSASTARLALPGMHVPGEQRKVFRFDVASHPAWVGTIARLAFFTGSRNRPGVRIETIRGLAWDPSRKPWARGTAPRWVDLGRDVRPSSLLMPERPLRVTRGIGKSQRFRASVGLPEESPLPAELRLDVAVADHPGTARVVRFEKASQLGRWVDLDVDLDAYRNREVEIRLQLSSAGAAGGRAPFGFVANPRIVGPPPRSGRPNVILVSVDTLRADALSLYGAQQPTSPHLAARARRGGIVFDDAIASAPSTLPSHASLFTGLDALAHNAVFQPASAELETLAEILRAGGYRAVAQTGGGYLHPRWGLVQGFDRYAYWLHAFDRDGELEEGVDGALGLLRDDVEAPFFLFLHTYEVHSPYRVREPQFSRLWPGVQAPAGLVWIEAEEPTAVTGYRVPRRARYRIRSADPDQAAGDRVDAAAARRLYESSVAYVDEQLERIWAELDRRDLWRETIVVVTSDHGEAFGEHGVAGHGYLYDDNLRVPLVVFAPQLREPRRIGQQVRLVDLLPTILELTGVPPSPNVDGRSLVVAMTRGQDPTLPRDAWSYAGNSGEGVALRVAGRAKLIYDDSSTRVEGSRRELFDLESDPGELHDRERDDPLADRLETEVRERLRTDLAGLRIEIRSKAGLQGSVRVEGEGVDPKSTKLLSDRPIDLEWADRRLLVRPEPGAPILLVLQTELGRNLEFVPVGGTAASGFGSAARLVVALDRLPARWSWSASSGWREGAADGDLELRLAWNGKGARVEAVGARPDTELIRQLQALGYVH